MSFSWNLSCILNTDFTNFIFQFIYFLMFLQKETRLQMLRIFRPLMTLWLTIPARLRLTMKAMRKNRQKTALLKPKLTLKKSPVHLLLRKLLRQKSVSILFLYVLFSIWYIIWMWRKMILSRHWKLFSYFDLLFEKCKTMSVFHFFQILFTYNLSIDHTSSWYTWVFYVLYRPERIFIKLSTDGATCDAYSFKLGSKKTIHMLCAQIPTVGPRSIKFHNNLSI